MVGKYKTIINAIHILDEVFNESNRSKILLDSRLYLGSNIVLFEVR